MCNLIMGCASMLSNESIENILKLSILKSSSFRPMLARESKSSKSKLIRDSLEWYLESFGQERFNNLYAQTMVTKMKCKLNNEDLYRQLEQKAFRDRDDYGLSNEAMYNNLYSMMLKEVEAITATESVRLRKKRKKKEQTILNKQIERLEKDATERDMSLLYNYHCRVICDKQDIHKWLPEKRFEFLRKVSESKNGEKDKEANSADGFLKYRLFRETLLDKVYPKFLREEYKRRPELLNFVKNLPDNK